MPRKPPGILRVTAWPQLKYTQPPPVREPPGSLRSAGRGGASRTTTRISDG
jgi:hypothetical protein